MNLERVLFLGVFFVIGGFIFTIGVYRDFVPNIIVGMLNITITAFLTGLWIQDIRKMRRD